MDSPLWLLLRGLIRGLHIAGSFSGFGTFLLAATLLRAANVPGLKRLAWISLGVTLLSGTGWLPAANG